MADFVLLVMRNVNSKFISLAGAINMAPAFLRYARHEYSREFEGLSYRNCQISKSRKSKSSKFRPIDSLAPSFPLRPAIHAFRHQIPLPQTRPFKFFATTRN